jgi:hypothetical protein
MNRGLPWVCALLAVLPAASVVSADDHLVLSDGQVLSGSSVELQGDLYLLTLESGDVLPLPVALVREVHRAAKPEPSTDADNEDLDVLPVFETEILTDRARELPSEDLGVVERPRRLIELPDDGRSASTFSQSLVDPDFRLTSGYEQNSMLGVFDTSFWPGATLDSDWGMESGFELPEGEPATHPDRWNKAAQGPIWKPKEGFAE